LKPKAAQNTTRRDPLRELNRTALRREADRLKLALEHGEYVARIYEHRMTNLILASDPMRGSDYSGAGTRSGGIPDPTAAGWEFAMYASKAEEIYALVVEARTALVRAARMLDSAPSGIDTASIAQQSRCTGGAGMEGAEEWGEDPANPCHELAYRTNGHNAGLCPNHIRYRNRWEAKQRAEVA
jgi:hypothetical protein